MCLGMMEDQEGPVLAAGNGKGELFVWDVTEDERVDKRWQPK